jgi:peptidoglycan/LPS O-acetylase OafA/YrhL
MHLLQHSSIALKSLYLDQIFGRIDQFLIGMGCAYLFTNRHTVLNTIPAYTPALLCCIGIAGLYVVLITILNVIGLEAFWAGHPFLIIFRTVLGLSVGCLIMGISLSPRISTALLANPIIYFLGTISYGIYLWHFPVHIMLKTYLPAPLHPQSIATAYALTVTLTTAAASISYFGIERPILNWAGRITKSKSHSN